MPRVRRNKSFTRKEWEIVLRRNDFDNVSQHRLKESLMDGIPDELRGEIWAFITKANQLSFQFSKNVYTRLIQSINPYIETQIIKDLHRTYPESELFREKGGEGQRALSNVLCAYSNYDSEVGYCQGMGFIVGCLFTHIKNEELTFWAFVQVMFEMNWRLMFKNGTPKLLTMINKLTKQVKLRHPDLWEHLAKHDLSFLSCFTQYLITVFLYDIPKDISVRVFDLFLLEGERVLYDLLLKMLYVKKARIMQLEGQELYLYLRSRMVKEVFEESHLRTLMSFSDTEEFEMINLSN